MRARIAGIALLVLLAVALLIRVTDQSGMPPTNPVRALLETQANTKLLTAETVDLKNGNLHLQIPVIRAAHPNPTAPRSDR